MKKIIYIVFLFSIGVSSSQELDKSQKLALKKANNYVYEGNKLIVEDFVEAEMAYRKAISEQQSTVAGNYNLGNSYYENGNFEEALFRHQEAIKHTSSKSEKHKAYHNIGNILMQNKKCKEAVEAYKNALRNNPMDDETRYNLGLAKICAEQQQDQQDQNKDDENKDKNEDKKDQKQDQKDQQDKKDQEGDNKEENNEDQEGEDDKKDSEDQKDEDGKPKDENQDKGKKGEKEKEQPQQPKPQPGQLSPQQVKSLLEAMNNQEQKVQDKINAEKQKGIKIKTEKDW
ncbi:tetratricopeptide repeat protein [Aestuariivivens marinum]|uniref:tetratricopeptide repeat protein n=1 Tax=Aestuariivivens marinum TaxID=2913555 RepID=UPI001F598810|nr:tetratricopeptide repeat protein [Aestuariivivens marinum]